MFQHPALVHDPVGWSETPGGPRECVAPSPHPTPRVGLRLTKYSWPSYDPHSRGLRVEWEKQEHRSPTCNPLELGAVWGIKMGGRHPVTSENSRGGQ